MSTEATALAHIQSLFKDIESWGAALREPWRPDPTSQLALDDQAWPGWPVTQLARASLGSARDHLQAVRVHIEAEQMFPLASDTLLRTAIVAGAQTVWMLSPDDEVLRQERGRTVAAEVYRRRPRVVKQAAHDRLAGADSAIAGFGSRPAGLKYPSELSAGGLSAFVYDFRALPRVGVVAVVWTRDEIVLACALVSENEWRGVRAAEPGVQELSVLLQRAPIHPAAERGATFRSPNSVQRKTFDIATQHSDYRGKPTKGNQLDRVVLRDFLDDPQRMLAVPRAIRSAILTGVVTGPAVAEVEASGMVASEGTVTA